MSELAMLRTRWALERTWLAYQRTSLTVIILGATFWKLFQMPFLGSLTAGSGVVMLILTTMVFAVRMVLLRWGASSGTG